MALVSTNKHLNIKIGDHRIGKNKCERQVGVKIKVNLNFNSHMSDLCKKASRTISALARVDPFPVDIYMFEVNYRNTRTRCEICSKLTIKRRLESFWCLYC